MWNMTLDRRIATNQWAMESQSSDLEELVVAFQRNVNRARVRLALERARPHVRADGAIRDQDGDIFVGPVG